MKHLILCSYLLAGLAVPVFADHITGGEIYYTYRGLSGANHRYAVTVKLFKRCGSDREFLNPSIISVFDAATGVRVRDISVSLSRTQRLDLNNTNPCITNPPLVCFEIAYYEFEMVLPASANGFIVTAHVVYRIDGMNNLARGYNQVGATYTATIPGTGVVNNGMINSSAQFTGSDLAIVCTANRFSYSFAASDPDGDELRYSFCNAYQTTGVFPRDNTTPPAPPPYASVPYGSGFSGNAPLGAAVGIDQSSGLITGIAPENGTYVITVCVEEIRNGKVIAIQRKDFQVNIANCSVAAATLRDEYMVCGSDTRLDISNISNSPLINTFNWDLTDAGGDVVFTSNQRNLSYRFADTGLYSIKLTVNKNDLCQDSAAALVRVYPGFGPDFSQSGACIQLPVAFRDGSTTRYGDVNSWSWDFGDNSASILRNPEHPFTSTGTKIVRLIAGNTVGCVDTVFKQVNIIDKPPIQLAFRDTLVCPPDIFQLRASGRGVFEWFSGGDIVDGNTATPTVSPVTTGYYVVELNDDGCVNRDSVLVRVVDGVSLSVMPDTVICLGDSILLRVESNGLQFAWTPSEEVANSGVRSPVVRPTGTTHYRVSAGISNCRSTEEIQVTTVPYPLAKAGEDTVICYNTPAKLQAVTDGSAIAWRAGQQIIGQSAEGLRVSPLTTTDYILYAYDERGCPKPGIDTVRVTVLADIAAFAGNDTTAVIGQPLQMQAGGGIQYSWMPGTGLSATDIANPVAMFPTAGRNRYTVSVYNEAGCVDSAVVNVNVYAGGPDIFVPSAFSPNGDGRNDFFEPEAAGIVQIDAFQVYNRWGQMMFSSGGKYNFRWDGNYGGRPQPPASYVWMLKAIDFNGRAFVKKGTVILIR